MNHNCLKNLSTAGPNTVTTNNYVINTLKHNFGLYFRFFKTKDSEEGNSRSKHFFITPVIDWPISFKEGAFPFIMSRLSPSIGQDSIKTAHMFLPPGSFLCSATTSDLSSLGAPPLYVRITLYHRLMMLYCILFLPEKSISSLKAKGKYH